MQPTARPNRINIDLQHYKQPWIDYCNAHNTTPSAAFRQVVAKLIEARGVALPVREQEDIAKIRKEIRLTTSEIAQAEALAAQEGFSLTRWIVALVCVRLAHGAQLGQQELTLLAQSNLQLQALGRNLNQIARAANQSHDVRSHEVAEVVGTLRTRINEHTRLVALVLEENIKRWRLV